LHVPDLKEALEDRSTWWKEYGGIGIVYVQPSNEHDRAVVPDRSKTVRMYVGIQRWVLRKQPDVPVRVILDPLWNRFAFHVGIWLEELSVHRRNNNCKKQNDSD
jgi:hypothetical protein